jgi:hypothetical protein
MGVVDASFDIPLKVEEKASMPLAGGIANMGYQCGMLWGAALAAGVQAYQRYGSGPKAEAEAIAVTQKLVATFQARTKNEINCLEISDLDMQGDFDAGKVLKFFLKGGPIGCFHMSARYAREAYDDIYTALSTERVTAPAPPVSCATMFARQMGVSEMHAIMAAGFAGGIGLSGGGCGVLGAAIWIRGLKQPVQIDGLSYSGTWVNEMTEKFLEISDYEFECAEIIGRKFDDITDHAEFLRCGGCSEIITAMAAT